MLRLREAAQIVLYTLSELVPMRIQQRHARRYFARLNGQIDPYREN